MVNCLHCGIGLLHGQTVCRNCGVKRKRFVLWLTGWQWLLMVVGLMSTFVGSAVVYARFLEYKSYIQGICTITGGWIDQQEFREGGKGSGKYIGYIPQMSYLLTTLDGRQLYGRGYDGLQHKHFRKREDAQSIIEKYTTAQRYACWHHKDDLTRSFLLFREPSLWSEATRAIGIALCCQMVVISIGRLWRTIRRVQFLRQRGIRVTGIVVDGTGEEDLDQKKRLTIEFCTATNPSLLYQFKDKGDDSVGSHVDVIYDPVDPGERVYLLKNTQEHAIYGFVVWGVIGVIGAYLSIVQLWPMY